MDYEQKLRKIEQHLEEHPHDYQSVISLIKTNSDAIAERKRLEMIEKKRKVAKIRAERRARHEKSAQ